MTPPHPSPPPSSYRHDSASRPNQPTVEAAGMLTPAERAPVPFTTPALEGQVDVQEATIEMAETPQPRLAWHREGRTSTGDGPYEWAAAPLYTREKVHPLTMIEQLRRPDSSVPLNLFDDFNGLPPDAQKWEFYKHTGRWQNRLIHGDSAQVMQSLIGRDGLAGHVQMIYFDPPYGIDYNANFMPNSGRLAVAPNDKAIPFGDPAPLAAFRDTWRNEIHSYLDEVHQRLVLFKELLADTGSLFIQIGDDNMYRLGLLCEEVFGPDNRVATVTWRPTSAASAKMLPQSASYLLWFAKDKQQSASKYHQLYDQLSRDDFVEQMGWRGRVELADGLRRSLSRAEKRDPEGMLPEGARMYRTLDLTSAGHRAGRTCDYEFEGVVYHPGSTRHWTVAVPGEEQSTGDAQRVIDKPLPNRLRGLDRLAELGRLVGTGAGGTLYWVLYEDEAGCRKIDNVWHRQASPTRGKRYAVQTDRSIIERCMLMCTDPGDLVLDPTCGSGVSAEVAEQWGRRWITIDVGRVAVAIARRHLLTSVYPWYRTLNGGSDPAVGFELETMQRVTAATLAYDEENSLENTIQFVDRPQEDKKRRRLTGPFTVESASPYTYSPFAATADGVGAEGDATATATGRVLEALPYHPIRDSDGRPVLEIGELVAWPDGVRITHEADCGRPGRQGRFPAAVMIAPADATVGAMDIAAAVAEVTRGRTDIDELIVVASAFDNNAPHRAGTMAVRKVVTSRDLQIAGLDAKSESGAFTLLGEPDVSLEIDDDGRWVVTLEGYDTYDTGIGQIRSSDGRGDVDCWMIDTDHDGFAFFPRLVYLPGYNVRDSNVQRLVKSLGRDLDPEALSVLCGLVSQPFDPPSPGRSVAVKIITRTGAEMTTTLKPPTTG